MAKKTGSRIEKYYTKIVVAFLAVSIVLVGVILFFSFTNTTITVTPKPVQNSVSVDLALADVGGVLVSTDVSGSQTSTDVETAEDRPGKATGRVTITNNYTANQPLVETTRLLSEGGVLFRTQETVTVPAGGSVEVGIIADQDGASGDIGPSHFTVVALWEGLQDKIYADSTAATSGGVNSVGVVSQTAVANAEQALESELLSQAVGVAEAGISNRSGLPQNALTLDAAALQTVDHIDSSVQAGAEATEFTVDGAITAWVPVVDSSALQTALEAAIKDALPAGYTLISGFDLADMSVELSDVATDGATATLRFDIPATFIITTDNPILDRSKLTNQTAAEVTSYLAGFPEIEKATVRFSPRWNKTTPSLANNISVVVTSPSKTE